MRRYITHTLAGTNEYLEEHISKHRKRNGYLGNGSGKNHWSGVRQIVCLVVGRHNKIGLKLCEQLFIDLLE